MMKNRQVEVNLLPRQGEDMRRSDFWWVKLFAAF